MIDHPHSDPVADYEERTLLLIRLGWRGPTPAREIVAEPLLIEQLRGARWLDGEPYSVLSVSRSGEEQIRQAVRVEGPALALRAVRLEEDRVGCGIECDDEGYYDLWGRRRMRPIQMFILASALVELLGRNGHSAPRLG